MNSFIEAIRNLGPARLGAIGVVAIALLGSLLFVATQLSTGTMAPLYSGLDPQDSRAIQRELAAMNEPFEMRNDGQEILASAARINELRIILAQEGLPASGAIGNEIFDRDDALGSSSFTQQVNRVRALEGELARSIATLRDVRAARVHIVLPERELFARSERDPSASVLLNMRGTSRLDRDQVQAVAHLVASAVPNMETGQISILDNRGTLLARGGRTDEAAGLESGMEMQIAYETRLAQRLEEMLASTVGFQGVRAEVTAEMDFSQQVIEREVFDPEGQVVVSTSSDEQSSSSRDGAQDPVTVGNNLPAPNELGAGAAGGAEENTSQLREVTNFQNSATRTNTIVPPGRVDRLSVAVVVDGVRDTDEDGNPTYRARTPEEMEQITAMARAIVGFDESRGDVVTVTNQRFADLPSLADIDDAVVFGLTFGQIQQLLQPLLIGIVIILILLVVVRPLLSRVLESISAAREAAQQAGETQMITDQTTGLPVPALPGGPGEDGEEFDSMIDIAHIEGRVKASSMRKIGEIIEKHPEEAVSILRTWMYQES